MEGSQKIVVRRSIQVFEHQKVTVGEQLGDCCFKLVDFEAMSQFVNKHGEKYFKVLNQAIKFKHYVGVIQVGTLTIEVLPKADKLAEGKTTNWQRVLLDMLKVCRFIKPEQSPGARIGLRRHMLFDLYIDLFLEEVEQLLRQGLLRQYQRVSGFQKALKGKLYFSEQLRRPTTKQQQFFCEYDVYTFQHPLNQLIGQALNVLKRFALPVRLQIRLVNLLHLFPSPNEPVEILKRTREKLRYNRKTERYRYAVDFAYLILLNYSPDVRFGQHPMVALLFDMNLLFEEYVYQKLIGVGLKGLEVRRQERIPFWQRRYLQPDLVLRYQGKRTVLDTKWKMLAKAQPSMEDLRQLFVYAQFFGAEKSVLLFPEVGQNAGDLPEIPYALPSTDSPQITCQVCSVPVLKGSLLNPKLGKDLLLKLGMLVS